MKPRRRGDGRIKAAKGSRFKEHLVKGRCNGSPAEGVPARENLNPTLVRRAPGVAGREGPAADARRKVPTADRGAGVGEGGNGRRVPKGFPPGDEGGRTGRAQVDDAGHPERPAVRDVPRRVEVGAAEGGEVGRNEGARIAKGLNQRSLHLEPKPLRTGIFKDEGRGGKHAPKPSPKQERG